MTEQPPLGAVISSPGNTVQTKTGGWRSMRPKWIPEKCKQCMICWQFCPDDSIPLDKEGKRLETDFDFCKGCGICARECPFKAIEMILEDK